MAVESALRVEALEAIGAYLSGERSGPDAAAWAMGLLVDEPFDHEPLLREALEALSNLDHEDARWDTPRGELEFLRDCLLGKKEFVPPAVRETHA